jgi:FkbM family methyltransferase
MQCVFDVGANIGRWAMAVHQISPSATIHAFEIAPQTCDELRRNTSSIPSIVTNNYGLADSQGPVAIKFFYDDPELSSLLDVPYDRPSVSVPSSTLTGDIYAERHGIDRIDLLKIDTEGSELLVLKGLSRMLSGGSIDVVQFEYSRLNIVPKFLLKDFYDVLGESRYAVGKLFPDHVAFKPYELVDETFMGPNYVAVRRGRPDLIERLS